MDEHIMSQTNLSIIEDLYKAFTTGDVPAVLGVMSTDIIWNEADNFPYADGNPYIGPEAVLNGVFARSIDQWENFAVDIEEILDAGDTVIAFGRYKGTFKATGKAQNTQIVHVWRIQDGKIVRFQQHADTLHVAQVTAVG
tara:strand:- start:113 stop:532 length:420 start_codon:yes stop_codon:yes gene_type:complete